MHLLLGAGEVGCAFARAIRCFSSMSRITIGDLSHDAAMRAAAICHGRGLQIDVADEATLRTALDRHDIVVSTIGPASRFGGPLLRNVIASGCHYVDVTDERRSAVPWDRRPIGIRHCLAQDRRRSKVSHELCRDRNIAARRGLGWVIAGF